MVAYEITSGDSCFRLDVRTGELLRDNGERVSLTRQQWELLIYFLENPQTLLTKDDLQLNVWKRAVVNDEAVSQAVRALRRALEDDKSEPRFIATIHGRGYQFIANVEQIRANEHKPPLNEKNVSHPERDLLQFQRRARIRAQSVNEQYTAADPVDNTNPYSRGVLPLFPLIPISYGWNQPETRHRAIARFSNTLAQGAPDESYFVDYFNFVNDLDYLKSSGDVHIATVEFDEVWDNREIYVPYESMLVRYKEAGLVPRRLFLVDVAKLRDDQYRTRFQKVVFRHERLELSPRIAVLQDAQSAIRKTIGINCDAFAVVKLEYALLIQLSTGQEPAMLKTNNRSICIAIRDLLNTMWNENPINLSAFEHHWGTLKNSHRKDAEKEAEYIFKISNFRRSLTR
jgi:DNA-binding winged helix-turn-helix (wHTH) protein